eukprot:9102394-Pyramimonas_sp.AAC.1
MGSCEALAPASRCQSQPCVSCLASHGTPRTRLLAISAAPPCRRTLLRSARSKSCGTGQVLGRQPRRCYHAHKVSHAPARAKRARAPCRLRATARVCPRKSPKGHAYTP